MDCSPKLCEQCAEAGKNIPADYLYQSEEASLTGPAFGDPDYWPPDVAGRRSLCHEHYTRLSADSRLDYIPAEEGKDPLEHLGETGTTL